MESVSNSPAESGDWSALRGRVEASRALGGFVISRGELQDLLAAANSNAEGQVVPAELLINALRQAVSSGNQTIVQLDIETADVLVTIASGELVASPAGEQAAPEPGLELIA